MEENNIEYMSTSRCSSSGRALGLGPRGTEFESPHFDQKGAVKTKSFYSSFCYTPYKIFKFLISASLILLLTR